MYNNKTMPKVERKNSFQHCCLHNEILSTTSEILKYIFFLVISFKRTPDNYLIITINNFHSNNFVAVLVFCRTFASCKCWFFSVIRIFREVSEPLLLLNRSTAGSTGHILYALCEQFFYQGDFIRVNYHWFISEVIINRYMQ